MNHRHIQTFLTVSAAFFAMSAPMYSNASCRSTSSNAPIRAAYYASGAKGAGLGDAPADRADEAGRNH